MGYVYDILINMYLILL